MQPRLLLEHERFNVRRGRTAPWESKAFAIPERTSKIQLFVERPTQRKKHKFVEQTRLRTEIVVVINGQTYRCGGSVSGGSRSRNGLETAQYALGYTLPFGFFGQRGAEAKTRRLGQDKRERHVYFRLVNDAPDDDVDTRIWAHFIEQEAPFMFFRSSVAFDDASAGEESSGDGVIDWDHEATGSDRAAVVGIIAGASGATTATSVTYNSVGMDELTDEQDGGTLAALYGLEAPATGVQNLVSTINEGGTLFAHMGAVISVTGAHQDGGASTFGTPGTNTGTGATASTSVGDNSTGDLIIGLVGSDYSGAVTPVAKSPVETQRGSTSDPSFGTQLAMSTREGSSDGTISSSQAGSSQYGFNWQCHAVTVFQAPAGGTQYEQSVAGSLTPTGAVASSVTFGSVVVGSLTPTGALVKSTRKAVAGTLAVAGALTKRAGKGIAGALIPAGALSRSTGKNVAGSVEPVGALATVVLFSQSVAGVLEPVGALFKRTAKAVVGALTPTGALTKETQKNVGGSVAPAGEITKETQKNLAGSVTPTGDADPQSVFKENVSGSLTPVGALTTLFIEGTGAVARAFKRIGMLARDLFRR